ncbi:MAG: uracil-DNA glycosylase [Steroidobacteraceae bacterium]
MSRSNLGRFLRLIAAEVPAQVFNPWTQRDTLQDLCADAAAQRLARLKAHLAAQPARILLGEASGYQGCHVSGIPFTSERLLLADAVPRVSVPAARLSQRHIPWSEPSATTVWGALHELGAAADTLLWNAYPWHPHKPGNLQSNRTPTPSERAAGLPVLEALLAVFPQVQLFAVGKQAQSALEELGLACTPLRHPSMGGAMQFRAGLKAALRRRG